MIGLNNPIGYKSIQQLEKPFIMNPFRFPIAVPEPTIAGWKEVGRTTLGSAGTSINVTGLPNKKYYMILASPRRSSTGSAGYNFDSSTATDYAFRYSNNGSGSSTGTNDNRIFSNGNGSSTNTLFHVGYVANVASKEKLIIFQAGEAAGSGAGSAPERFEQFGKYSQTSTPLTAIGLNATSNYAAGSELVILGWDPTDTHTDNFWEELASVNITSGSQMTATFADKKYLWIQFYYEVSTTSSELFFNNDQGNNYARRYSNNGGSDGTTVNTPAITTNFGFDTNPHYGSMFVVNNSANEKLVIANLTMQMGSGAATTPQRTELVSKWVNTSSQINRFDITNTGTFSRCICKVWGSN